MARTLSNWRKRMISYEHMSLEEIDDHQTEQLLTLIEEWRQGEWEPWQIYMQLGQICNTNTQDMLHVKHADSEEVKEFIDNIFNKYFRPEIFDPKNKPNFDAAIDEIEQKLLNVELNSWDAAIALAEVLICPLADDFKYGSATPENEIYEFHRDVKKEEKWCRDKEERNHFDFKERMKPDSEDRIRSLAEANIHAFKKRHEDDFLHMFKGREDLAGVVGDEKPEETEEEKENLSRLYEGDDKLCDTMMIAPSGTGLIGIDVQTDGTHDFYGVKIARVTTYSLSFKAITPEKTEDLKLVIEEALAVLQRSDRMHHYLVSGSMGGGGNYRENYERPSHFTKENDGVITIPGRMDLDDLWFFYYMIEPVLEPSAQIATAMDMARYAEERGAPLDPDTLYLENQQHDVAHDAHEMKADENALPLAIRDAFHDAAIGRINKEQLISRLTVLADHSLQGKIQDPKQLLPTFDKMIADQTEQGGELITYEDAVKNRVHDFIRVLTGNYEEETPLGLSLMQMLNRYGPALKEAQKQAQIKREEIASARIDRTMARYSEQTERYGGETGFDDLLSEADGKVTAENLADAFDKLRGHKRRADETLNFKDSEDTYEARTDIVPEADTQLVIRDSEVETCLDDLHHLGYTSGGFWQDGDATHHFYRSKTKGSLLPRKELPTKLKPFAANYDPRQGLQALELKIF